MLSESDSIFDAVKADQLAQNIQPESKSLDIANSPGDQFMGKSSFKPSDTSKSANPFRTSRIHEKVSDIAQRLNFTNSILSSLSSQQAFKLAGEPMFKEHKFNSMNRKKAVHNTFAEVGQIFHFGADRIVAETVLDIDPLTNKQRKLEMNTNQGKQQKFLNSK